MREQWKSNMIVGAFVLMTLIIFLYFIMNYTNELGMFEPRVNIYTTYEQPVGLFPGAAVQLNHVKIGRVTDIHFAEDPTDNTVYVEMVINRDDLQRIGKDARATITTKGLLGDNIINIEAGHPGEKGHIGAGDYVESEEYTGMFGDVDIDEITKRLESILAKIDEGGLEAISSSVQNISDITGKIKSGEGSIGKLVTEEKLMNDVAATVADLKETSARLNKIVARIEDEEVATKVSELAENLSATGESLDNIAKSIDEGEGTVGALIKDPTLYEDLKIILQGAKRSKALKYAVQHTIRKKQKQAEKEKEGE